VFAGASRPAGSPDLPQAPGVLGFGFHKSRYPTGSRCISDEGGADRERAEPHDEKTRGSGDDQREPLGQPSLDHGHTSAEEEPPCEGSQEDARHHDCRAHWMPGIREPESCEDGGEGQDRHWIGGGEQERGCHRVDEVFGSDRGGPAINLSSRSCMLSSNRQHFLQRSALKEGQPKTPHQMGEQNLTKFELYAVFK
jgi:hypothetical protein